MTSVRLTVTSRLLDGYRDPILTENLLDVDLPTLTPLELDALGADILTALANELRKPPRRPTESADHRRARPR